MYIPNLYGTFAVAFRRMRLRTSALAQLPKNNNGHSSRITANVAFFATILLFAIPLKAFTQTIVSPLYTKRSHEVLQIDKIERNENYTLIQGVYTNQYSSGGGWANINNKTYIQDCRSGRKYHIIKSEGLPLSPNKQKFNTCGETVHYKFYFPPIDNDVDVVDMIEPETSGFKYYGLRLKQELQREYKKIFEISNDEGKKIICKPSLQNRINGVKKIQLYIPHNMTDTDNYVYQNFADYLRELGISVELVYANYVNEPFNNGYYEGYFKTFNGNFTEIKNSNTLCAAINYNYLYGRHPRGTYTVNNIFADPFNEHTWVVKFEMPTKRKNYMKELKENILTTYNYNPNYAFVPPSIHSTWNEEILREYLTTNTSDPFEGIYKGAEYTVGVKRSATGYFVLYLGGADNYSELWEEGEVKAILTPTATPTIFETSWIVRLKKRIDWYIIFKNGAFLLKDDDGETETFIKMYPTAQQIENNRASSGSGFFLSTNGYIVTNHHVIENARSIKITGINDDYHTAYSARVEISDKQNDLAILKITDSRFRPLNNVPYTFKYEVANVGEECFVLGYPLISSMGTEIKLTNGIISSKTGFAGNIAEYQMSAPVQPGNSGGPLFDKNGNVIGVVCAKHTEAENASYAIKANYIRNLVELLPVGIQMPQTNLLFGKTLPNQVEMASKSVCLIIVND